MLTILFFQLYFQILLFKMLSPPPTVTEPVEVSKGELMSYGL